MRHELNVPPPGGWPVGSMCRVLRTESGLGVGYTVEVMRESQMVELPQLRTLELTRGVCQRVKFIPALPDCDWRITWLRPEYMRPISDPDPELNRETEREVTA